MWGKEGNYSMKRFLIKTNILVILSFLTACSGIKQADDSNLTKSNSSSGEESSILPLSSSIEDISSQSLPESNLSTDNSNQPIVSIDSSNNNPEAPSSYTTVSKLLPKAFKQERFDGEIRVDWYMIIGNGFYDQQTFIMTNNTYEFYEGLKNLNVNATPEKDHTLYGGDMAIYSFGDTCLKIWSGFLFIENENVPYKGDFYKLFPNDSDAIFVKDVTYHSFRIDAGDLEIKGDATLSSAEIRSFLSSLCFSPLNDVYVQKDIDTPVKIIRFNSFDTLLIYSEKEFSISTSDRKFALNDGYSFASIL